MFLINVQPHNKVEFATEEILRLKLMKVITPFFFIEKNVFSIQRVFRE